jgi:putative nucleotide binding protein
MDMMPEQPQGMPDSRRDMRGPPREGRAKEEVAIVLDFLPHGYPFEAREGKKPPIAQAIGKEHFTLLELVPKPGLFLQPFQEVYIGEGKRDQIHHIVGKLTPERLTPTARTELDNVVRDLVKANEQKFVDFFNKAQPLTTRMHILELLPGIGKQHMWEIIEKRQEAPFSSFADVKQRIKLLPDPEKSFVKRIVQELLGKEKHKLFVDGLFQ